MALKPETPDKSRGLSRSLQWALFFRSLSLQASWNHQRMQNLGLLWSILPWLRRNRRDVNRDRIFCRQYFGFFNTNPYLANFLLGGLARLEDEQVSGKTLPGGMIGTFADSVGRALASLGDQLFWLGLRPTLVMVICLAGLLGHMSSVLVVIGIFAASQLFIRWLAVRKGYNLGMDIVDLLHDSRWHAWIGRTKKAGMVLTGMVMGLFLAQVAETPAVADRGLVWVGTVLGMGLPVVLRKRLPGEVLMIAALALALLLGFAI